VTTSLPYPWGRWSRYRPHDGRRQAGLCWKRGKGSWFIEFRVKSGVRMRETVRGSRDDAEERLTQLLREHDVTGIVPDREATVAMFSTRWRLTSRTASAERSSATGVPSAGIEPAARGLGNSASTPMGCD
jgi:hypothetical protein